MQTSSCLVFLAATLIPGCWLDVWEDFGCFRPHLVIGRPRHVVHVGAIMLVSVVCCLLSMQCVKFPEGCGVNFSSLVLISTLLPNCNDNS